MMGAFQFNRDGLFSMNMFAFVYRPEFAIADFFEYGIFVGNHRYDKNLQVFIYIHGYTYYYTQDRDDDGTYYAIIFVVAYRNACIIGGDFFRRRLHQSGIH